jgi:hypothetical protein
LPTTVCTPLAPALRRSTRKAELARSTNHRSPVVGSNATPLGLPTPAVSGLAESATALVPVPAARYTVLLVEFTHRMTYWSVCDQHTSPDSGSTATPNGIK